MISSLVVKGCHKLNVTDKKIKVGETVLNIEKEIPFIRYRFNDYGDEQLNYIKSNMEAFDRITHLAEITVSTEAEKHTSNLKAIDFLRNTLKDIAIFLYVDITDEMVAQKKIPDDIVNCVRELTANKVDRLIFRDKSKTLDMFATRLFENQFKGMNVNTNDIGVCSSPLSFSDSRQCLNAIRARELMATYSKVADVALPSANHQCMNCCGCIRYLEVNEDTAVIEAKATVKKTKAANSGEAKPKAVKVKKQVQLINFV